MKAQYATRDNYIIAALASGKYVVDADGTVFNTDYYGSGKRKSIAPYSHPTGYLYVTIKLDARPDVGVLHHRIVAIARHGQPPEAMMDVNHIDGNKTNNHPSNLEWVPRQENMLHAYATGLKKAPVLQAGETHHNARLTAEIVRESHRMLAQGVTRVAIADHFQINDRTITSALRGDSWKHIYREFHP